MHICFEIFSKQICNIEVLICHFYKNIQLSRNFSSLWTLIYFTGTIFYRHYEGLHLMRKDLVLCCLIAGQWNSVKRLTCACVRFSGVARAFPGGRVAHPEGQIEEENEKSLRKNKKNWSKFEERMRKVELLPTRDCEAGYGPGSIRLANGRWHWLHFTESSYAHQ